MRNLDYLDPIEPDESITVLDGPSSEPRTRKRPVEHANLDAFDARLPRSVDLGTVDEAPPMVADRTSGYIAPWKKKRAPRRVDPFAPQRMRDGVRIDWPAAPEDVVTAQRAALAAIDTFDESGRRLLDIAQDAEDETIGHEARVAKAYRDDKPLPTLEATDWAAAKVVREIQHSEAYSAAQAEMVRFQTVVSAARPEWLASVVAVIEPAHEKAREAVLMAAREAREWRAAVDAADSMSKATGVYGPAWHQSPSGLNVGLAMDGLQKLVALVESDDPVVSGAFLTSDEELSPPSWTREALARRAAAGADFARVALLTIEQADREGRVAGCAQGRNLKL